MKILLIRTTNGVSGTETHNLILFSALRKQKDIYTFVLTNHKPFFHALQREHIPVSLVFHPIFEVGTKKEFLLSILWLYPMIFIYLSKIKQLEKGKRFDTIILESMTEKLFLSPFLKLLGYRVIWIEQGSLFNTARSSIVKWFYRYKSTRPDTILAVSEDTKRDLVKGGITAQKIKVVHIGVDQVAKSITRDSKIQSYQTIGFLGSVTKEKGIAEFLDCAKKLLDVYPKTKFLIIGGGPLLSWAKNQVKIMHIGKNVIFTGFVENVRQKLSAIDILYFPTHHHEGLSLALLEAMSMGKVVVARDIGGNRELIIDKKTGFLFKKDADGEQILKNIVSGKVATLAVRNAGLEHVRTNFFMKNQVKKFIEVFRG